MENEEITVTIQATVTVKYKPYNHEDLNTKAREQMKIWVYETLNDESQIPLFIIDKSGQESTTSKHIEVVINE
jgi:hypothetical protein